MSARILIAYAGDLGEVAEAFAEGARAHSGQVRIAELDVLLRDEGKAGLRELRRCDAVAFGVPGDAQAPPAEMMRLLELTEPLWASGLIHDTVVTVFTDRPQVPAADAVIFPIYSALYHRGAVVVGPRDFELPDAGAADARLTAAHYRGRRFAHLAGALAAERAALARVQL
jgi:multimeric flavodoxin WrbA